MKIFVDFEIFIGLIFFLEDFRFDRNVYIYFIALRDFSSCNPLY